MDLMINVLQTDRWVVSTGGRGVGGGGGVGYTVTYGL